MHPLAAGSARFFGLASGGWAWSQDLPGRQDDTIPAQAELVYEKGLQFLAKTQNEKGAWNDSVGSEAGVVGLCVASFLAHGEDPVNGPYAKNIRTGIDYILTQQNEKNGYIGSSMYNHAFATKALAESYGVVDNPKIAPALKKAVEMILSSQKRNRFGAWRYTPDSRDADTTVTGCQMVTLFAARNAGIAIPDEAIRKGLAYLNNNRSGDGSYGYTSAAGGKPTLTAIGILCLSLAKERDSKGYQASLEYLKKNVDYRDRYYPYYFEYYMSQALFHADEATWKEWNARNIRYLSTIQGCRRIVSRQPRPVLQHRRRAALAGTQLPLSTHLRKMIRKTLIPWLFSLAGLAAADSPDLLRFTNGDQLHGTFLGIKEGPQAVWQREDVAAPVDFKTTQHPPYRPARRTSLEASGIAFPSRTRQWRPGSRNHHRDRRRADHLGHDLCRGAAHPPQAGFHAGSKSVRRTGLLPRAFRRE